MAKKTKRAAAEDNPRCVYFWQQERMRGNRVVAGASGCARTVRGVLRAAPKRGTVIVYGRDPKHPEHKRSERQMVELFYFKDGRRQRF